MSTDPYPEVTGDESGIVPSQSGRAPEWPKKIRTLTATELDRLTIDGNGRFYWDGKLVNYEPPESNEPKAAPAETQDDRSAMEILDRAAHELGDRNAPESTEQADVDRAIERHVQRGEHGAMDFDMVRPVNESALAAAIAEPRGAGNVPGGGERMRVTLSRWQSLGAIILVLCIAIGALGVATYGFVTAFEWGCRTGMIQSYCPAAPAARPPQRSDIPA